MGREFAPLAARCGQRGGAQKISPREETVILQLRQHLQRHLHPSRGEVAHHRSYSVGKRYSLFLKARFAPAGSRWTAWRREWATHR
jgi:hypothetical protein